MKKYTTSGSVTKRMTQMCKDMGMSFTIDVTKSAVCLCGPKPGNRAAEAEKLGIPRVFSQEALQDWFDKELLYDPEANRRDSLADDGCIPISNNVHYSCDTVGTVDCSPDAGVKHDAGKLRFDLIPVEALEEVAKVFTYGAGKYAPRNWERGMNWGRVFAATMRHAWAFWRGETHDPETGFHHMAHAAFGCLALVQYSIKMGGVDDRP